MTLAGGGAQREVEDLAVTPAEGAIVLPLQRGKRPVLQWRGITVSYGEGEEARRLVPQVALIKRVGRGGRAAAMAEVGALSPY